MAQNSRGDKRVVEVVKSTKVARERVIAIEKDFVSLGVEQWCERYRGTDVFCKWLTSTPRGCRRWAQSEKCIRASSATRSTSAGSGRAPRANCATCRFGP